MEQCLTLSPSPSLTPRCIDPSDIPVMESSRSWVICESHSSLEEAEGNVKIHPERHNLETVSYRVPVAYDGNSHIG